MRKKGKKKILKPYYSDALLTLQFHRTWSDGPLQFSYTVNAGDLAEKSFIGGDYEMFGRKFSEASELNYREKKSFSQFCKGFLMYFKENLDDI